MWTPSLGRSRKGLRAWGCLSVLVLETRHLANHFLWFSCKRQQKGLIICCDEVIKERNYNYREGWVRKKWGRTVLVWSKQVSETISVLVNVWAKTHHHRMKMPKGVAPTHLDPQDRAVHAEGRRGSSVILWEHQSQATGTISKVTC